MTVVSRKWRLKSSASARPLDWALLAALVAVSGSAFVMIRAAVATVPPPVVACARLWIGAVVMVLVMLAAGRKFPPLFMRSARGLALHPSWAPILGVSLIGYTIPYFIFPWAQQYIESGLAGVYMAFMPIWTIFLAHLFAGERLTAGKLAGFALGFVGVLVLLGPDVLGGAAHSSVIAQASLLVATFCYAVSAIIARRTRAIRPRVFTAGAILGAAIFATPALFFVDLHAGKWSISSVASLIALAVGPTGLAGLILIVIIKRAGAGFMALANYLVPVWAIFLGALLFGERLESRVFLALAIILTGVAISQRRAKTAAAVAPAPAGAE